MFVVEASTFRSTSQPSFVKIYNYEIGAHPSKTNSARHLTLPPRTRKVGFVTNPPLTPPKGRGNSFYAFDRGTSKLNSPFHICHFPLMFKVEWLA